MTGEIINHVRCPHCNTAFRALPEHAGRRAKCSHCGGTIVVPGEPVTPPSTPPDAEIPIYAGVNCFLCGTRMYGTLADVGKELKCPDCGKLTKLPPSEIQKKNIPAALEGEQYDLWEGDNQPWGTALSTAGPEFIAVECRLCQTHLQAKLDQVGKKVRCHDCGADNVVRLPAEGAREKPQPKMPVDEYEVEMAASSPTSPLVSFYLDNADEAKADAGSSLPSSKVSETKRAKPLDAEFVPRPKLPRWPLISGTVSFLRSPGVPSRWIVMASWLTIIVWLGTMSLANAATMTGGISGAPAAIKTMGFLVTATIIGVIWSLAMSAIALAIVYDSSEGNEEIHNWPTSLFMDWLTDFYTLIIALLSSAFPGWLIAKVSGTSLETMGLSMGASVLALLPITVLSQLANNSPWAVVSTTVLTSWFRCPLSWLGFWLHATTTAALVAGAAYLAFAISGWFIILLAALSVGAIVYYCRVMGRLGWVIAETAPAEGSDDEE